MFYVIYKITNLTNGYIYIGQHTTNNIDDGYMGSGIRLTNTYKKYGLDSFKKEILYVFDNFEEMDAKEAELVNEEFIKREDTYNIVLGGTGWCTKGTVTVEFIENPGVFSRIPSEHYDKNKHRCSNSGTVQVYMKSTGEKSRVSVDEYHANKHLYNAVSTGKLSVRNKITGKTSSINIEEFEPQIYDKVFGGVVVNKDGVKQYVTKEEFAIKKMKGVHQNKVTVLNKETNVRHHITKEEYRKNKHKYMASTTGLVRVVDRLSGKSFCLDRDLAMSNREKYIIGTEGWRTVYDVNLNKFMNIPKENFDSKEHKLASDKRILCYNSDGSVKFEFWGSKIDFLKTYKCPSSVWNAAIKSAAFNSKHVRSKEFNGCNFALIEWKP